MPRNPKPAAYDTMAIALHWTIAVLIIAAIVAGEVMPATGARGALYALHASLGLAVILLSVVRLGWRLARPSPAYPVAMPGWQKLAARALSAVFYVLMIALPLTGWLAHSAEAVSKPFFINSSLFGLMPLPILPVPRSGAPAFLHAVFLNTVHELASNVTIPLLLLHAGAALKHHLVDRDDVLDRMMPRGLRRR